MKHNYLRKLLESRMEIDYDWLVRVDLLGKGLKKRLPPDLWTQLEHTYAGAQVADNWEALANTMELFYRLRSRLANVWGMPTQKSCMSA
jgi:hypothetical protein